MASYLVQAGANLYYVNPSTLAATQITLPTGITLFADSLPCRATLFGSPAQPQIIVVNGGTHDFWIDQTGTARQLQISSPIAAPVLANGGGSGLTGTYGVAATFKVKDANGATVFETGLSPLSKTLAITNSSLRVNNIPVSGDGIVNARGLYRTLTGGTTLYPWFDIDDNTTLADDRGGADASLSILPTTASLFGSPPDLKLCVQWKDRLWGVPRLVIDNLRWTEERTIYGWAATNEIVIPPKNTDSYGVVALIPRRDDLGVARRKKFYKIVGNSNDTFQRVGMGDATHGCVSQESVVVKDNIAYFLGERGVVEWSDEGLRLISEEQVDSWFTQDATFNRSLFNIAQGKYNPDTDAYELLLAAAGSTVLNRWVSYHIRSRTWFGPHKTDAFTPSCCATSATWRGVLSDVNTLPITVFGGSDGFLYKRDGANINDHQTAVALHLGLPPLHGQAPDNLKFFGQPTIHTRAERGGILTITPQVGDLGAVADAPITHDLTVDREVLEILGDGRYAQLALSHASTTEQPRIYGLEVPYTVLPRR